GFAIILSVLSLQMVGDGLRDMLDPRLRRDL
ncbi:MAG: peptide ABC transporter permease, partial [Agrobacterium fabrum]